MSRERRDKYGDLTWYEGAALPEPKPYVSSVTLIEDDEGNALRLRVSGYEEAVARYLEEVSFAFRVRPIEDPERFQAEQKLPEADEARDVPAATSADPAVSVELDVVGAEPPFAWEVLIDPVNEFIAGAGSPHHYNTTATTWMRATITADSGRLEMSSWGRSVVVGSGNRTGSIERRVIPRAVVPIKVDGLDSSNQYDLFLEGAVFA